MEDDESLKNACKRDRQFQDKKHKELQYVHDIMQDETLSKREKWVSLVIRGFGKQAARKVVYGGYHDFERSE